MSPLRTPRSRGANVRATAVAISLLAVALLALVPDAASAGRYEVVQCDRANRAFTDAEFDRTNGGDYGFLYRCEEDEDGNSLQIRSITGAPQGRSGRISWSAPAEARIVAVDLEARMRTDAGHQARLSFFDAAGNETGRIATGTDSAGSFEPYGRNLDDGGRQSFGASLTCVERDGCRASDQARNWIRSVDLTLEDRTPPKLVAGGSLVAGGWKRAVGGLSAAATDAGSGIRSFDLRVNGTAVPPSQTLACALIAGTPRATRLRPCPSEHTVQSQLDTRSAPFVDGANAVRICASDFGTGAVPACVERTVMVDNTAPELSFANAEDRDDPELIRASATDRHSGVGSGAIAYRSVAGGSWHELPTALTGGELRARVDSLSEPAGRYVFRAVATDRAGNMAASVSRRDGTAMLVDFPLRESTRISSSIGGRHRAEAGYGRRPVLAAVLRGPDGPIAGQEVELLERFAPGSSLHPVGRTVRTDRNGRISVRLSRGPSRTVRVGFAGTRRYQSAAGRDLKLAVRGSASIDDLPRRVRAGRRIAFEGSIGSYGAAIPKGKLVELQVRGGGVRRYRTVGRAFRTDSHGDWRLRYRFDRFYDRPTRYRFRLKVSRERSFPYRTPATSAARALTVVPRR
jgi:hypothetical protein